MELKESQSMLYNGFKLLYLIPALFFYGYILVSNELWWMGVIGNFIEMESVVTSIHSVLKRVYSAYDTVDGWCKCIQAVSVFCIRFMLPLILYNLFNNQHDCMEECSLSSRVVQGIMLCYVGGYNLIVFYMKCRQVVDTFKTRLPVQIIKKQPVPYIEINDIFGDVEKAKASKLSVINSVDPYVFTEKPPTWSMVGMEDISSTKSKDNVPVLPSPCSNNQCTNTQQRPACTKPSRPIIQNCFNNAKHTQQPKRVRFTDVFEQNALPLSPKPTSNVNMDTAHSAKATGGYQKQSVAFALIPHIQH